MKLAEYAAHRMFRLLIGWGIAWGFGWLVNLLIPGAQWPVFIALAGWWTSSTSSTWRAKPNIIAQALIAEAAKMKARSEVRYEEDRVATFARPDRTPSRELRLC
jgi:hypothetical protein